MVKLEVLRCSAPLRLVNFVQPSLRARHGRAGALTGHELLRLTGRVRVRLTGTARLRRERHELTVCAGLRSVLFFVLLPCHKNPPEDDVLSHGYEMNRPQRILGVDPGSRNMGWAVIDCRSNGPSLLDAGVIKTKSKTPQPQTLLELLTGLEALIAQFKPEQVAIEDIFFSRNARSAMRVGEARAMILLAAAQHGMPLASYTPQQLKIAAAGHGHASKEAVQAGIQKRLGLSEPIRNEHAADAVAAALRHLDQF